LFTEIDVTVHMLLVCTLFGSEVATDSPQCGVQK